MNLIFISINRFKFIYLHLGIRYKFKYFYLFYLAIKRQVKNEIWHQTTSWSVKTPTSFYVSRFTFSAMQWKKILIQAVSLFCRMHQNVFVFCFDLRVNDTFYYPSATMSKQNNLRWKERKFKSTFWKTRFMSEYTYVYQNFILWNKKYLSLMLKLSIKFFSGKCHKNKFCIFWTIVNN